MTTARAGRRCIFVFLTLACLVCSIPAFSQKAAPPEKASGLEDWEHDFDISKLSPGIYNIVVTGTDVAGNVDQASPINVYVDPNSDLPIVSIINPAPLQRVGGDLNIVGTCRDDDGVASVEVSLDGGDFKKAEGGEFWSLYLKTKDIPEGRRTLAVRGVDVNGLTGPVAKVSFDLDRTKPAARAASPEAGSLVAGQITISGTVYDANGVASLEASFDGGKAFSRVKLARGKEKERAAFSIPLDTRKFRDGPEVIWFRSVDGVGSKGSGAFLIFIDNTKPVIKVVRPKAGASVNGRFTVAGTVSDSIGVAELSYEFDGAQKGDIPLVPGDPYFAKEFDAKAVKGDAARVTLVAVDKIGNVTRLSLAPKIDRQADKPRVLVSWPKAEGRIRPGEAVWGAIEDDDGGAAVLVSVDKGAPVEYPASDVFSFALPALPSGRHLVSIQARDVEGALGDAILLPITADLGPGKIAFKSLGSGKQKAGAGAREQGAVDYAPGLGFRVDESRYLEGIAAMPNPPAKASYAIAGGAPRALELAKGADAQSYSFKIPLDRSMPYGYVPLEVSITDAFGNVTSGRALLFSIDLSSDREDTGLRFDDPRIGEGGKVTLSADEPLVGAFYREEIASLRFDPPTDVVKASADGHAISIAAAREGLSAATKIVVKTKLGHEFSSAPFIFDCDDTAPRIAFDGPAEGQWFSGRTALTGRVDDAGGVSSVAYIAKAGAAPKSVSLGADGRFSIALMPADFDQGPAVVEVEATDAAGNASRAFRSLGFDTESPKVTFLSPQAGSAVSGSEDVAAIVSDLSGVASVEFAPDGASFAPIERRGGAFIHRADLAANPKAAYRVTDRAGNSIVARPDVVIKPRASVLRSTGEVNIEPQGAEPRIELAGLAGARKIALVLPALSEADFQAIPADSPPPERFALRLLASGSMSLKGQVKTDARVASIGLSLDGGATYSSLFQAKDEKSKLPAVPLSFAVDTTKMANGEAKWILKVEDGTGAFSFAPVYAVVDNAKPEAVILTPPAGALAGPTPLVVRVSDGGGDPPCAGLAEASIAVGAEKRSLPLADGGSFYASWIDFQAATQSAAATSGGKAQAKVDSLIASIDLKDAAGNAAQATAKYVYDAAADLPRIDISLPQPMLQAPAQGGKGASSGLLSPAEAIRIAATDDDGAPSLSIALDGGEAKSYANSSLAMALSGLAAGKHSLMAEARDESGNAVQVKREFAVAVDAPAIRQSALLGAAKGAQSQAWTPGMLFDSVEGGALTALVSAGNGLVSLEYRIDDGASQKASLGPVSPAGALGTAGAEARPFSCAIAPGLSCARHVIEIIAKDGAGLETKRRYDFHSILPALPSAPPADTADALRFWDSSVATDASGSTLVSLAPGDRLVGSWNGRPLRSVALSSATALLAASIQDTRVVLEAKGEGRIIAPGIRVMAETIDGDRFEWGPFALSVDQGAPDLKVDLPANDLWTKASVRVSGSASDPNGIVSMSCSLNGGEPVTLPAAPAQAANGAKPASGTAKPAAAPAASALVAANAPTPGTASADGNATAFSFDYELPLSAVEDGAVRLDFVARDSCGRETRLSRFINKDTVAPSVDLVLPDPADTVNGTTTFVGEAVDRGHPASVTFLASKDVSPEDVSGIGTFSKVIDLARVAMPLAEGYGFSVTDKAGNRTVLSPAVTVDAEKDKPVVEIQAPADLEVLRADFSISGAVYDDDGVAALYYRIDQGEWKKIEPKAASFIIPMALADQTDNEHLFEAYAEDLYGVKGELASRRYRISKEEPTATMTSPALDKPVRGVVELAGTAADANGIASVSISFDNATSYDRAIGLESWHYPLDTRILADGLHAITIKPVDKYDTTGFYATLATVDNTPPVVELSLPDDGAVYAGSVPVSGRVSDNIKLASARIEVAPVGKGLPAILTMDLGAQLVVRKSVDVSALEPGTYTLRLVGRDRADNESLVSRNIVVKKANPSDSVDLLFPVEGQETAGPMRIYGRAIISGQPSAAAGVAQGADAAAPAASGATAVTILLDGADVGFAPLDSLGYFAFDLPADKLVAGQRSIAARAVAADGRVIASRTVTMTWKEEGPWIVIDSLAAGAYVPSRPYLSGRAGWAVKAPDPNDKAAVAAFKASAASRKVSRVELSLDNGASYHEAHGGESWKFRLETQDYPEGGLHLVLRATFGDGSVAVAKTVLSLDKTPPVIKVAEPEENGRFNEKIHVSGTAADASGLKSVGLSLRKGDKRGYEVPAFIQGLYLDGHVFGGTQWEAGAGLTFFGDNVKLQATYGQTPALNADGTTSRFYGDVYSAKLIANVLYLPMSSIFGPDWNFLSASIGVGAEFSYFSQNSTKGVGLSAVVAQVEFPKLTLKDVSFMKKFSFYFEEQAWFIASDVSSAAGFELRPTFGARIGLF
jgi:hypothetical protein